MRETEAALSALLLSLIVCIYAPTPEWREEVVASPNDFEGTILSFSSLLF
jgi:hypothetical protein